MSARDGDARGSGTPGGGGSAGGPPEHDAAEVRARLGAAVTGAGHPARAADRLCRACVELLGVDGAEITLVHDGVVQGTLGSDGWLGRHLGDLQFTFGEGPCSDAVRTRAPVLAADLDDPREHRWPGLSGELLAVGVRAAFALPVRAASSCIGTLDLVRRAGGELAPAQFDGALVAAKLAALPLVDLMTAGAPEGEGDGWGQLDSLERVEVYQATGMLVAGLEVGPAEALVRLRGRAVAEGMTVSEVSWDVVERRLPVDPTAGGWGR